MARIVAYTYEADVHCVNCTNTRFGQYIRFPRDTNGIPLDSTDREGNTIHPVFSTDEVTTTHFTHCGTCLQPLER